MRLALVIVLAMSLSTAGWSEESDLALCRTIADPLERVACYDAALDAASQESAKIAASQESFELTKSQESVDFTESRELVEPTASPTAESLFGRTNESIKDTLEIEEVSEIAYPVIEIRQSPLDRLIVELENGQIWMQTDATRLNLKLGDIVRVRAGLGGSYYLQKASGSRSVKVKRMD